VARAVQVEDRVNPVKEPYTFRRFLIAASWIFWSLGFLAEVPLTRYGDFTT